MQEQIINNIVDFENLHWAWKKLKSAYKEGTDIWLNPIEISSFEGSLEKNILNIREDILKEQYSLSGIYPVPYPKSRDDNGTRTRPAFYVSVRDQLTWIAIINIIGSEFDYQMPYWSFGHRLFLTSWVEHSDSDSKFGKLVHGWYRNSTNKIYRSWRQSWPRFRRHVQLTIRAMSGLLQSDMQKGIISNDDKSLVDSNDSERQFLKNNYLLNDYWGEHSSSDELFWCTIDFKRFYPSINRKSLLKNFAKYHKDIDEGSAIYNLISKLLDFKIHPNCNWEEEELEVIGVKSNNDIGLPTGLIVSGFLSNIALLGVDKKVEEIIKRKQIACFRFVDDHIILSKDIEVIKDWYILYNQILSDEVTGAIINNNKTEPVEFREWINDGDIDVHKVAEKCKLDPDNPTPLVTRTLMKLSLIAGQDINFLTEEESVNLLKDLDHFLLADFADHEIKKETQVSFALTVLSKLVPKLKKDYSKVFDLRKRRIEKQETLEKLQKNKDFHLGCENSKLDKRINISNKEIKEIEELIIQEIKEADLKYSYLVNYYFKLFVQVVSDNYSKPKLWLRILEYCANTGYNKVLSVFKIIDKLKVKEEINDLTEQAINNLCINIISRLTLGILSKYESPNKIEPKHKQFLEGVFETEFIVDVLKNRLNGNKYDVVVSKRVFLLLLGYYSIFNKSNLDSIKESFSSEDLEVFSFKHKDRNEMIFWLMKETSSSSKVSKTWLEISRKALSKDPLYDIIQLVKCELDSLEKIKLEDYRFINRQREVEIELQNLKHDKFKTIQNYLFDISLNKDEQNLLFSEYAALLFANEIIEEIFKKKFHDLDSPETKDLLIHPGCIMIENYNPQIKINSWNELNYLFSNENKNRIKISYNINGFHKDKRYLPDKIIYYKNKDIAEIYALGIIIWQMCNKEPLLPFSLFIDNSSFYYYLFENDINIRYYPSSYSESLIYSCISSITRESYFWIDKRIQIKGFKSSVEAESKMKGFPPLVYDIDDLSKRIKNALKYLQEDQLNIKDNIGRQLVYFSFQKPSVQNDFLSEKIIKTYSEYLNVGIIQTTLNKKIAWNDKNSCNIDSIEGDRIWSEIISGIKTLISKADSPDIILLPELTIPRKYINTLCKLTNSTKSAIIAGLDYNEVANNVSNEAIVVVPGMWPEKFGYWYRKIILGKFHFARIEKKELISRGFNPVKNPYFYLFDSGIYGRFGVAICADLFDIERFSIYKGQIQHLFVIAYNQDITSFYFIGEAISRMVFCNVIICNTGFYGGSMAFSPYNEPFKRYIYKHEGASLFNSQLVKIPVRNLIDAQKDDDKNEMLGVNRFKYHPPGYEYKESNR